MVRYFEKLSATSDRVKFEEIGKSTMGAPFVYATISSPENLKRLDEYKEIQRQLADPRTLGSPTNPTLADRKARALIARGKTIVAITCGIHSTEVGSYLSSMLIAYRLASSNDPDIQEILRDTIILLVPSTNPDGVDIVNNWYQKNDPIAKGMPKESIAWAENSPVFEIIDGNRGSSPTVREGVSPVKVIAWYPSDKDPLLSGWLLGGDRIKGKAALVEVGLGKGRIILFGFRPQYRGQSLATYPLFFNAISGK